MIDQLICLWNCREDISYAFTHHIASKNRFTPTPPYYFICTARQNSSVVALNHRAVWIV